MIWAFGSVLLLLKAAVAARISGVEVGEYMAMPPLEMMLLVYPSKRMERIGIDVRRRVAPVDA